MNFIEIPNLPAKKVHTVLVDCRISEHAIEGLRVLGIIAVKSRIMHALYPAVSGHPDMQLHHFGGTVFCCAPEAYAHYSRILPGADLRVGKSALNRNYPFDIAYNVGRVGRFAFHKLNYTDTVIRAYYEENGVNLIDVNQGYSKCSICPIAKNAMITSDIEIAKKADTIGIDVLFVSCKNIILKGLSNGFIGGACGLLSDTMLGVNGNLALHPDFEKIGRFCENYNVHIHALHNGFIEDIGSIIPLSE